MNEETLRILRAIDFNHYRTARQRRKRPVNFAMVMAYVTKGTGKSGAGSAQKLCVEANIDPFGMSFEIEN